MFFRKKDRVYFVCFILIIFLGISVGINYQKIAGDNTLKIAKNCFEFGFYDYLCGSSYLKIFFSLLISFFKHFVIFSLGKIFLFFTPIIPINLFGITFKMGVVLSYIISIMRTNGFLEIIYMGMLCVIIIGSFMIYSLILLTDGGQKNVKVNMNIKSFFVCAMIIFVVCLFILFLMFLSDALSMKTYGILKTFL